MIWGNVTTWGSSARWKPDTWEVPEMSRETMQILWSYKHGTPVKSSSDSNMALVVQIAVLSVSLVTLALVKLAA